MSENVQTGRGKRRRRFSESEDENVESQIGDVETQETSEENGSTLQQERPKEAENKEKIRQNVPSMDNLRDKSRKSYLKQRQLTKLEELKQTLNEYENNLSNLSDKELQDYHKKTEIFKTIQGALQQYEVDIPLYSLPEVSNTNKKTKYDLLHQNHYKQEQKESTNGKSKPGQYAGEQWEQEQFNRAKQISSVNTDKINLPGQEKNEFVFDESQYVTFDSGDQLTGDKDPETTTSSKVSAAERTSIDDVRKSLPVFKFREQFLEAVKENPVLIVVGETGSGKTTQLPQYLHEAGYSEGGKKMIGCTQPRRVAATSVATRVAQEMDSKLGQEVGYTIRFEDKSSDKTIIKYLTDGMLLREFLNDPELSHYGALMIDEAHERTLSTEVLLSLLKDIVRARPDLKLIIASATINATKFSEFFDKAPILNIPGRRFPVNIHYTKNPEANYIQAAITTIFQIHLTQPLPGDILVFLTGQEEIETMEGSLNEAVAKLGSSIQPLHICSIYANLPQELQSKIFEPTPPNSRKVVLATNIAETSITIDGIAYVIDPGYVKQNVYNPLTGMESLVVVPCSRASADQRAGRAGRIGPGKCFRLYTKWSFYNELELNPVPEILRVNLISVILLLLSLGINDLINFDFMDPPSNDTIIKALELLYALGALNSKGQLTKLGRKMNEFPLDPMFSKCILTSSKYGCSEEILTIIAMLGESGTLFYRPKDKREQADKKRETFNHELGDHFSLLKVWQDWEATDYSNLWCEDNFIQYKTLKRAKNVREQLARLSKRVGVESEIDKTSKEVPPLMIQKSIVSGFFPNIVRLSRMGDSYRKLKQNYACFIHPSSSLYPVKPPPRMILYHELVLTSKEFMRNVMVVDEKLVKEFGSHYYSIKDLESATNKVKK
ncbi:P-loop containing nucleoside triphosphate hydrolase protein [Scheffersomyces xylosifermentans]|uniref:P-loop containing nucleoside triphosphate hydrolase protein n=1 Tax=Scheffersomyces xylosifermentans TaxID=1304137 RepID=UPI00315D6DF1